MLDEITLAAIALPAETGRPAASAAALSAPAQPEHADPEFPAWIWRAMFACYAVFFAGLWAATGRGAAAIFMIVVSIGYTVLYFGAAGLLIRLKPAPRPPLFAKGLGPLRTFTGPMSLGAVAGQVLTIPACLALFGVAIAIIRAVAG